MILSGGGREITIPGKNVKVNASFPIERKDLSGQSSDSSFANAGAKPQNVNVSCQIPIAESAKLAALIEFARACDSNDDPIVYDVSDPLCNSMSIRKVIFSGEFRASESDALRVYEIAFELQEYRSVAQRREERANANAAAAAPAVDGEKQVGSTNPAKINQIIKETAQG